MAHFPGKNNAEADVLIAATGSGITTDPYAFMHLNYPSPGSAADYATATNAAATITYSAGGSGVFHAFWGISWSLSAVPASAIVLSVTDNGTTIFAVGVTNSGPGFIPICKRNATANTDLVISLAAAGSGIIGRVNVLTKWTFTNA